jgi:Xaa-Pro aminopeptidase
MAIAVNQDRIRRAQELMINQGLAALMIMNHDDHRYFFGDTRVQPRAIIPVVGHPIFICFAAEEPELRQELGDEGVKVFTHVGEQIFSARDTFHRLFKAPPPGISLPAGGKLRVGMQMWFATPAFLVDLFRKVNFEVELVSSDPVMDELRMAKEPQEIELMRKAQSIAAVGMNRARELLRPGATGQEIAAEVLYAMMKAGAEGTSTPIHVNSGIRSCWTHGRIDRCALNEGDLVVIDLTPEFDGYCGNLARTFVLGRPDDVQGRLLDTYREICEVTRQHLRPGITVAELDALGLEICTRRGLAEQHLNGISHGIGLRFEETPASTIIPQHRKVALRENMTVTIGHTVLAIPGVGGVRFEDVYLVTRDGGQALHPYPMDSAVG